MLKPRQEQLLKIIIEFYIENARPVASQLLVACIEEGVSSATIRNEMVALEQQGYIIQPHTSAGRVPTEKAYQFYIEKFLNKNKNIPVKHEQHHNKKIALKNLAKATAAQSGLAVIVAFGEQDNYYTGISNLFAQPEFREQAAVVNLLQVVDFFDNVLTKLYQQTKQEPVIKIGKQSCFGDNCSFIFAGNGKILFGILGPMRMDYQKNYSILKFVLENL